MVSCLASCALILLLATIHSAAAAKTAQLGLILPHTNDGAPLSGNAWQQVVCATLIALAHVNGRNDSVVPEMQTMTANLTLLNGSLYDSGYSVTPAIISYFQMRKDGAVALVGPARSAVSKQLAQFAKIDHIPQVTA